ncbi:retrovirus-related pol polyprotein from transposon TNT 1-94 [Tanacetum coccineum]
MFKLDLDPLALRLLKNRDAHIDYLMYTQEQADILRGIVEQANLVPLKETTSHSVEKQKTEIKVYSKRPKQVKSIGSSKQSKIIESRIANNLEPNHSWGSNAIDVPSSSSLVNDRFKNDQIAKIMGYDDYQLGNVTISRNLDSVDLLSGSRDINLYTISLDDMLKTSPICLLLKASKTKSWLWYRRLSHLNCGTLYKLAKDGLARGIPKLKFKKDHLCLACALGKSKKSSHQPKAEDTNQEKLYLLHMDLCGPMRVENINDKRLVPNLVLQQPFNRLTRNDWDRLFQPMVDEYFNPPLSAISLVQVAATPKVVDITDSPMSTLIDQDAPSTHLVMLIKLKWIFKVKKDECGGVLKNKARLVAKAYRQEEGIDFQGTMFTCLPE